jgi:cobalt-zinc-cadmium efflux system protein
MAAPAVHHHHSHQHPDGTGKLKLVFWLNLSFCLVELAGGFYTNSIAILSDALHDFGDSLSLGLAWYFEKISRRKPDSRFHFGYRRFSVLGALINSIVLLVGSILILREAIERIAQPEAAHAAGMIWLALGGILVNGFAAWRLHGGHSLNEKAVSLHLIEDVLGWAAIMVGAIFMFYYELPVLDPILSIAICLFIMVNIYRNSRDVFRVLLQGQPRLMNHDEISHTILEEPEVLNLHDLRIWSLDNQKHILSVHVVVRSDIDAQMLFKLKTRIKQNLHKRFDVLHATIETETEESGCVDVRI